MSESPQLAPAATVDAPSATPLAGYVAQHDPAITLESYAGSQTPLHFAGPSVEIDALLHQAAVYDLGYRTFFTVTGSDRVRWLNGMVSNTVQGLKDGEGNYSLILNAQGRIQADACIFREPTRLLLQADRSQADHLLRHLDRFIIMDDVELAPLQSITALGVAGPRAAHLLDALGCEASSLGPMRLRSAAIDGISVTLLHAYSVLTPRFELWFDREHAAVVWTALLEAGAAPAGTEALESLRILEGTPRYGIDITERLLPQETAQVRALNFNKGCYLGQEIVERIRSRATIHRRLAHFALHGAPPSAGIELQAAGQKAAELSSVATFSLDGLPATVAIGLARAEAIEAKIALTYDGGTATVLDKPPVLPGG